MTRFNQSGFKAGGSQSKKSRVADLFAQVDALQADERDHDLDELAAFDMNMRASRLVEEHQRDSRIFLDSYERDTDLLHDDNDMQELQMALNAAECVNDEECSSDAVFEALKSEAATFLKQLERNMTHLGHASKKFKALKQVGAAAAYRRQA